MLTKSIIPMASAALAAGLISLTGCTAADLPTTGSESSAVADVTVSECSVSNELGAAFTHATIKITNSTDRAQSYIATIGVNDAAGARIGEINTASNALGAGQSVTMSGPGATGVAAQGTKAGPATCVVANVTRVPS
ncbi:MAG: hypothetical protein ACRDRA_01580 [Pseudonocardiaceae bacterium]